MSNVTVQEALKKTVANKIDTEILSKWIDYNHETGIFTWKLSIGRAKAGKIAGNINRHGYREINFNNKNYLAHRVAYSLVHGDISDKFIDHINGVRDDNRICNLRAASREENQRNAKRRKDNKTGIKGVKYVERDKHYVAVISNGGKQITLGCFKNIEDAKSAREDAALKLHGEFANHG